MSKSKTIETKVKRHVISTDLRRILRTLDEKESFYFYKAEGQPLGEKANSLTNFAKVVETIDPLALEFHYNRGDFGKWIKFVLGDSVLGYRLDGKEGIILHGEDLRNSIQEQLKNRFHELNIANSLQT
jgi:hypothetical protein